MKQNESGRSMVEMLGVLAIVGVLSVGGIAGLRYALTKNKANTLIYEANKRATVVAGQIGLGSGVPSLNEFTNNDLGFATFESSIIQEGLKQRFGLQVTGLSKAICEEVVASVNETSALRRVTVMGDLYHEATCGETGDYLLVYNANMGTSATDPEPLDCSGETPVCGLNFIIAGTETQCPCSCPEHRAVANGRCGDCEGVAGVWSQPILDATHGNGTMGIDEFAVAADSVLADRYAWKAFDNANGAWDHWHSNAPMPHWLSWYTATPIQIQSLTITNRIGQPEGICVKDFGLQYSDDNIHWTTAYSGVNANGQDVSTDFVINEQSIHKYWRLYITSDYHVNYHVAIGKLKISARRSYTLNPETFLCE